MFLRHNDLNLLDAIFLQTAMVFIVIGVVVLLAIVLIVCVMVVVYWLKRRYKQSAFDNQVIEASYMYSSFIIYSVILVMLSLTIVFSKEYTHNNLISW